MKSRLRESCALLCLVVLCAFPADARTQQTISQQSDSEQDFQRSLSTFTNAFRAIEKNYADPVNPDSSIYGHPNSGLGAIPGMLRTLDPHSNFFDPHSYALLREQQEGRYYGIGMRIQGTFGKAGKPETMVLQPMPGSPAFRAGLRPGDIIIRVDDKPTDGLDSAEVATLLKGPNGTTVRVAVTREGTSQPLDFAIQRAEITSQTVNDAFFIRPHIAYIHVSGFSETTDEELTQALATLNTQTLQGLVLDLRGNPGGLVDQAVDVSDHFLQKGQLIVYHNGRQSPEMKYYATKGDGGNEYPIVVLINRMTASAAEIVTGALQDHDRALIMGEPSFGKGLVQTVFPLSEGTGLALTTAHYYTPSGRLIQRDYSHLSIYDYYYHFGGNPAAHSQIRLTDGGRQVYGGGGIMPDVLIQEPKLNPTQQALDRHSTFFDFGRRYLASHPVPARDFQPDAQTFRDFSQSLKEQGVDISDQDLAANRQYIMDHIREQVISAIYGSNEADKIVVGLDPMIAAALANLDRARQLTASARQFVAAKGAQ